MMLAGKTPPAWLSKFVALDPKEQGIRDIPGMVAGMGLAPEVVEEEPGKAIMADMGKQLGDSVTSALEGIGKRVQDTMVEGMEETMASTLEGMSEKMQETVKEMEGTMASTLEGMSEQVRDGTKEALEEMGVELIPSTQSG